MKVWVIYANLDQNYSSPIKIFSSLEAAEKFMQTNKDQWGLNYCLEEFEVETGA